MLPSLESPSLSLSSSLDAMLDESMSESLPSSLELLPDDDERYTDTVPSNML